MNPHSVFCPNPDCKSRGRLGLGNIGIKSQKQRRYRCKDCQRSFAETSGTPLYGLKKPASLFTCVRFGSDSKPGASRPMQRIRTGR